MTSRSILLNLKPIHLLSFFNTAMGKLPDYSRSIFIFAASGEIIGWKQTTDVPWLTGDRKSGVTDGILKMSIDTTGISPGIYHGNITIESPSSTSAPITIPVSLIVNPDSRVEITTWKDGKDGAFSVSVDDGQPSGYNETGWEWISWHICNQWHCTTFILHRLL